MTMTIDGWSDLTFRQSRECWLSDMIGNHRCRLELPVSGVGTQLRRKPQVRPHRKVFCAAPPMDSDD
jgi:hypothetical protein